MPPASLTVRALHRFALLAILAGAFAMRVTDLEGARSNFPDLFDEGIRVEQLFLMSQGFRPYRDIYAAQGPLLLDTLYPFYRLFGETLGAVRLGVGLLSLIGLVGAYLVARELGGRFGGLLACGLLALSPPYLEGSRLALAEVPSIAPALLGLAFALRYRRAGSRRWLVASAIFFAVALLLKPMVLPVGVAIGLALLGRPFCPRSRPPDPDGPPFPPKLGGEGGAVPGAGLLRGRGPDLARYAAMVVAVVAIVVVAMGPREVFEQLVLYRAGATGASAWDARASWKEAVQGPVGAQPSLYVLAAVGATLLLSRTGWRGAPLVAWPLATFALLFFYTPLHPKHLVYLAPPAAVLAGAGLGVALRGVSREAPVGRWTAPGSALIRSGVAAAAALLLIWNVATVQPALARGVQVGVSEDDLDLHVFDVEAARTLRALTSPGEIILTDHPYLAFLARRMVPPELVDPSRGRTRAGTLTDDIAARSATERDTRVVLFWADRLRRLGRFNAWVEQRYRPVASFGTRVARSRFGKDRTVYLRQDADFDAARAALVGLLERPLAVDFADDLRLLGSTVDLAEVAGGEPFAVSLVWEALRDIAVNYHVILSLVGPDGQEYAAQEQDVEGTGDGTAGWRAGAWLYRGFMLAPDASALPGEYRVLVGLDNTRTGRPAPVTANREGLESPAPGRVVVGTVRVR